MTRRKQKRVEICVTRPTFYRRDEQNSKFQEGYFFTGETLEDCRKQAIEQFPHEEINITITRQWNESGDLIYKKLSGA